MAANGGVLRSCWLGGLLALFASLHVGVGSSWPGFIMSIIWPESRNVRFSALARSGLMAPPATSLAVGVRNSPLSSRCKDEYAESVVWRSDVGSA